MGGGWPAWPPSPLGRRIAKSFDLVLNRTTYDLWARVFLTFEFHLGEEQCLIIFEIRELKLKSERITGGGGSLKFLRG